MIHYSGQDYLIPSDATLDDPDFLEDYLVSTDLGVVVDRCDAKTILLIIDACREGVKLDAKDISLASWSRGERRKATQRSLVIIFACGPGQVSQYVNSLEEPGFSLFTQALATTLAPEHPAVTVNDVLQATQENLSQLVEIYNKRPQEVRWSFESAVQDSALLRIICDGTSLEGLPTEYGSADLWSESSSDSLLWPDEDDREDCPVKRLKAETTAMVKLCWQIWQAAEQAIPEDSWKDKNLPIRVLEALELLVLRSDPPVKLTIAETALLVIVPFLREAVLASGLIYAANVDYLNPITSNSVGDFRQTLEKFYQEQPRFIRKVKLLQKQGKQNDANALMIWLLYRCLFRSLALWQPKTSGGYLADELIEKLESIRCCGSRLVQETLILPRLLELTKCVFGDLERIDRDDRSDGLQARFIVGRYREEQIIREKMLAYLLNLAGWLAIDIRTLSEVLVDHVGLSDPITPEQIHNTIGQARWNPSGRGRILRVSCNHPALDLALQKYVDQANISLIQVLRQVAEKRHGIEVLAGIPTHLLADGIVAEKQRGRSVYQTPHTNFQLAHDEVRELLMGEKLYGDPMLAIRELYQNALDACRYKEARLNFLHQTNQYQEAEADWEGLILFRQGIENGRPFLECEDNGIGMGMQHLRQCFARAGRRFADLPEFIEEQAEWLKCDPPIHLYPNSQFGVGVLSYFMLADELEVETCRLDYLGKPQQRLQVHIPGSSGLFRVQNLGSGIKTGTRVRLYLNRTHHKGKLISCIETLRRLLWIADFRTEVYQSGRHETWLPGQLRHPEYPQGYCLNVGDPDIWWVPESKYKFIERGCILSDGIFTEKTQPGFVVNLRHENRPKLTVDRKKILDFDYRKVCELVLKRIDPLLNWAYLDFYLLWKLADKHPSITKQIVKKLSEREVDIQLLNRSPNNLILPLQKIKCIEVDLEIARDRYGFSIKNGIRYAMPWWLAPYRVMLWSNYGLFKVSETFLSSVPRRMNPEFCPNVEPGDGVACRRGIPPEFVFGGYINSYVPPGHIIHASARLNEDLVTTINRFQRLSPYGLEIQKIDTSALENLTIDNEDLIALSRKIEETRIFGDLDQPWKHPWLDTQVSPAQLVLSSTRLVEPLQKTFSRFQRFKHLGIEIRPVDQSFLERIEITPEDIILLSEKLDGEEALVGHQISPAHLAFAADRLNETLEITVERFQKFKCLGLELPNLDLAKISSLRFSQDDLLLISDADMAQPSPWDTSKLPIANIIRIAWVVSESPLTVLKQLKPFQSLGLKIPNVNESLLKNLTLTREDVLLFSEYLGRSDYYDLRSQRNPLAENRITSHHVIAAAVKLKESASQVFERFQKFSPMGLEIPELDLVTLDLLIKDDDSLTALSENLNSGISDSRELLQGEIHPTRIILAALALEEPVHQTLERFRRFALALDLDLPRGELDSWEFPC